MDTNNWRPTTQGGEAAMDAGDWRSQLQPDSRQRIVNKIMETLKRHLPVSGQEGLHELRKIAVRFEEKIYTAANSQSDYLRKISLKMLTMETKSQNSMASSLPSSSLPTNSMVPGNKPPDSASHSMQSQVLNQGQSLSVPLPANQPQSRQQLLSQNIQNNITSQSSSSLPSALPSVSGLTPSSIPNIVGQNPSMQNVSGVSQNPVGNSMGQGVPSNGFTNSQRPIQGRQVIPQQQQQQQQSQTQQQYLYQQQLQQQLLKQKFPQGIPHSLIQSHMQQQQQNVIQPNQLQSSQQSVLQTSSVMQPSLSSLTQNQQSPIQQPTQSMVQQPPQPVLRQQQHSQQHAAMHQQPSMSQQTILPPQQQQLIGQQPNATNMQQNQLIGQQNNIGDMQQQLPQQPRLHGQQNNLANLQSPPQQQQQLMAQQNNLSNLQQQQQLGPQSNVTGLQQQQMHGTQSGNSNMQTNQHSAHMLQQNKVQTQQQPQQNTSLLSTQGQQAQLQPSQPQLMSQIPPQSTVTQLQQQVPLQQQQQQQQPSNAISRELQQRLQVSGQGSGPLLQSQNVIDQQKQLYHSQRPLPETSSTSLDSTAQTGQANGGDWQEEIYQKIKAMKELHFVELRDMYQKICPKVQQFESLPQQPKSEQLNKLKAFKTVLERLLAFLQVPKSSIVPGFKDKIGHYEKQIISFIHSNKPRNQVSSLQQGQIPASHMNPIQQSQAQMSPLQSPENQINPPMHAANMQGSVASVQQNSMSNLQHSSISSLSGPATQQNMMSSLQPGSSLESGQGNSLSSLTQVATGSLNQNPANTSQQANNNSLLLQSGVNALQANISSIQLNSNILQHQHLKQQEQQQLLQSQQLKQQMQQRHMHQHIQQRQILQQQQQPQQPQLHQQQSQLHQPGKQQLPTQLQAHQMSHLNQINDINDLKMRQGLGVKPGMFQQHPSATQRSAYPHQQLKPGASFPISPPIFQPASPQVAQNSSPQVDQQNLLSSIAKTGTPLQSASSPFIVPSPSTPAPSPMLGDSEKPMSAISSLTNAANIGQQTSVSGTQASSLAIGTPGISASPLLAEFSGTDNGNAFTAVSGKTSVTEQPLERLIKAVKSMSPKALNASVSGIGSVVSMIDRIAGSAPGNGSRAAVGEDLVALTKCRLQARSFVSHDGTNGTKKMRRYTSAMPLNAVSSSGSVNDFFKHLTGVETSDLESTATSSIKRPRVEANHVLLEEIREINQRLIDTVLVISDEVVDPSALAAAADGGEGTIVKCSFTAVALSPSLKSQYASAQMSPIQPLRLLVPTNYPNCSPILLDKFPVEVSKEYEDLSVKAKSRFSISLRNLSQPMSLGEIARTWDVCARTVVSEYAQQSGGGSFCSKYGTWENCLSAA